jgi:hypothetical protein
VIYAVGEHYNKPLVNKGFGLWAQMTPTGKTVRDMPEFVIAPVHMP